MKRKNILIVVVWIFLKGSFLLAGVSIHPDTVINISIKEKKSKTESIISHDENKNFGYIPPSFPPDFKEFYLRKSQMTPATFPSVYDLRDLGELTPVRDQGACESCWAFATYGSIESRWKILGKYILVYLISIPLV